jgi:DNA-binding NarL/FixJ family response regulator
MSFIQILIAEDHAIARAGLTTIVNSQPDMRVIAEAESGGQAVVQFRLHRPDITLMDIRMPVSGGIEAVRIIRSEFPGARIIALSTFGGDEDVRRTLAAGVQAYLTKDVLHDDLITAIRAVHAGRRYLTPLVTAALSADASHSELSAREIEVLRLIVEGLSNNQIAFELNIAKDTVKNHVKNILSKLGAVDRTQAATEAIQRGIIHLPAVPRPIR